MGRFAIGALLVSIIALDLVSMHVTGKAQTDAIGISLGQYISEKHLSAVGFVERPDGDIGSYRGPGGCEATIKSHAGLISHLSTTCR